MLPVAGHPSNRPLTIVQLACLALSGALFALLVISFVSRLPFPFELEWMEGATVVHVQRLMDGRGIYVSPSLDFVPFAYPPLYYVASVPLAWVFGTGFLAVRLVSVCAALGTLFAIFAIVRRDAGAVPGYIAAGTFAGCYALSDAWLDLGRVDALYLALMAIAWWLVARARTARGWVAAGAVVALAFLAKQPALLSVAPLGVYLLVGDRRAALPFGGTILVLSAASFALLDWQSGGWYRYYVMELPRMRMQVSLEAERILTFWTHDLLRPLPIAVLLGLAGAIALRRWRDACLAVGLVGTAWMARLEGGAWQNAVLPAYLAVAVLFGLALQRMGRWFLPAMVAAAVQLAILLYDPRPFLPSASDRAAGERIVNALRTADGPVLVVDHSYWSTLARLPEHAHGWAVTDVVWSDRTRAGPALEAEIRSALRDRRFETIVLDEGRSWFRRDIEGSYMFSRRLPGGNEFRPRSGAPRWPTRIYAPRP